MILPDSITSIGDYAFFGCNKLTKISIPGNTEIGYSTFSGCKKLKDVELKEGTRFFRGLYI